MAGGPASRARRFFASWERGVPCNANALPLRAVSWTYRVRIRGRRASQSWPAGRPWALHSSGGGRAAAVRRCAGAGAGGWRWWLVLVGLRDVPAEITATPPLRHASPAAPSRMACLPPYVQPRQVDPVDVVTSVSASGTHCRERNSLRPALGSPSTSWHGPVAPMSPPSKRTQQTMSCGSPSTELPLSGCPFPATHRRPQWPGPCRRHLSRGHRHRSQGGTRSVPVVSRTPPSLCALAWVGRAALPVDALTTYARPPNAT